MLFTMTEVVVNVITMILEDIVVFILAFPTGTTTGDNLRCDGVVEGQTGDPFIAIKHLSCCFMSDDQVTPINGQGILTATERHIVEIAIGPDFPMSPIPLALAEGGQTPQPSHGVYQSVEGRMRITVANKNKITLALDDL